MVKVGEVEFLVKFDGINTEFKKVLKSALSEVDLSVEETEYTVDALDDIQEGIDDINKYLNKITTPTHGNYFSFASQHARGAYEEELKGDFREDFIEALNTTTIRNRLQVSKEELSSESGREVREEIADDMIQYILELFDKSMTLSGYKKNMKEIENILGWKRTGTYGTYGSDIGRILDKFIIESYLKEAQLKIFKDMDIEAHGVERRRYYLKRDIGSGTKSITEEEDVIGILQKYFTKEQMDDIISGPDISTKYRKEIFIQARKILKEYKIKTGVAIFGSLIKVFDDITQENDPGERIWDTNIYGYTRADILFYLNNYEDVEKYVKSRIKRGGIPPEEEEDMIEKLLENITDSGYGLFLEELFKTPSNAEIIRHLSKGGLKQAVEHYRAFLSAGYSSIENEVAATGRLTSPLKTEEEKEAKIGESVLQAFPQGLSTMKNTLETLLESGVITEGAGDALLKEILDSEERIVQCIKEEVNRVAQSKLEAKEAREAEEAEDAYGD